MSFRKALLAAGLALPVAGIAAAGAHAASARVERTIRVPAGSIVLVLPGAAANAVAGAAPMTRAQMTRAPVTRAPMATVPADFPVLRMMARQDAMARRMMHQMHVLDQLTMALPDPAQMLRSVMDQVGHPMRLAPGSGVVTTVVSGGRGVCRQTVTYRATANGARPQVHVVQTGDACGALAAHRPIGVTQTVPQSPAARPDTVPAPSPHHPRLWSVSDPAQVTAGMPRT